MRIAVLGFGSIGRRHFANLGALGLRERAVFDPLSTPDVEGATHFSRLEELWKWQPNVAFITAPTAEHVSLALAAAQRACHLFIEKPLSHSLQGVDTLQGEIAKRGLISMVGCNMRFHPAHAFLRQELEAGTLGDVLSARLFCGSYLPRWRPHTDYRLSYSADPRSGGAILDSVHELDLALWHFGAARLEGAAWRPASSLNLATDGLAELLLRHESGPLSSVHLNFVQRDYRRGFEVIGTRGTLRWDWNAARVELCDENGQWATALELGGWKLNQMYRDEIAAFLAAVQSGKTAPNGVEEAARTLELALQARKRGQP